MKVPVDCNAVDSISIVGWQRAPELCVDLDMDIEQMRQTFGEFCRHVSELELANWFAEFCPELLKDTK